MPMRTSNPALSENAFRNYAGSVARSDAMTIEGTVVKTGILLACAVVTAAFAWSRVATGNVAGLGPLVAIGAIGGMVSGMILVFKAQWSPTLAPVYALFEGLVLGGLSGLAELRYPGIAFQAMALTFGTLACLLLAYRSGLVKVTDKFRMGVVAATGAIMMVFLVSMVLSLFHVQVPMIWGNGPVGIGFSLLIVGIAALNLVLDFDFIERGAAVGAPKFMEWYGAFGLMVTLIWLYIEILRLLAKFRSRD